MERNILPDQPIYKDGDGTLRFVSNGLVRHLLDYGGIDMNQLAVLPGITVDERRQFAQLIGYSVDGYCGLNYVQEYGDELNRIEALERDFWEEYKKKETDITGVLKKLQNLAYSVQSISNEISGIGMERSIIFARPFSAVVRYLINTIETELPAIGERVKKLHDSISQSMRQYPASKQEYVEANFNDVHDAIKKAIELAEVKLNNVLSSQIQDE